MRIKRSEIVWIPPGLDPGIYGILLPKKVSPPKDLDIYLSYLADKINRYKAEANEEELKELEKELTLDEELIWLPDIHERSWAHSLLELPRPDAPGLEENRQLVEEALSLPLKEKRKLRKEEPSQESMKEDLRTLNLASLVGQLLH